jgi:calcium-dependent protein kinase
MGSCNTTSKITEPKKVGGAAEFTMKYKIESKVLGAGSFGKVLLGTNLADSHKVAIKALLKRSLGKMHSLNHPNIIEYYETYENSKYMYLVMEYCEGGELIEEITKKSGLFKENDAVEIIK